jgi:hypothetical protein
MQTQHLVQLPKQQQPAIRANLGTVELQPHTRVKIDPKIAFRICTKKRDTYLKFNVSGNIQYRKVNVDIAEKTYREILRFENE